MVDVHIGIDPATVLLGVCAIDGDGNVFLPHVTPQAKRQLWTTYKASGNTLDERLDSLEGKLSDFLTFGPSIYFSLCAKDYRIRTITIENPASGGHGYFGGGKSRFDTSFVLGRAMQMVVSCCRTFRAEHDTDILLLESKASESSAAVGLNSTASKKARNLRCAQLTGGHFHIENEDHPEKGFVVGGPMDGAGPDALDAMAAALSGRDKYINHTLLALAHLSSPEGAHAQRKRRTIHRDQ